MVTDGGVTDFLAPCVALTQGVAWHLPPPAECWLRVAAGGDEQTRVARSPYPHSGARRTIALSSLRRPSHRRQRLSRFTSRLIPTQAPRAAAPAAPAAPARPVRQLPSGRLGGPLGGCRVASLYTAASSQSSQSELASIVAASSRVSRTASSRGSCVARLAGMLLARDALRKPGLGGMLLASRASRGLEGCSC